jgi:hypothetical protein
MDTYMKPSGASNFEANKKLSKVAMLVEAIRKATVVIERRKKKKNEGISDKHNPKKNRKVKKALQGSSFRVSKASTN